MNGQGSDFMKQMKEKAQHNLQMSEKSLGSLGKELGQDTWGFLRAQDPWNMQQSQDVIKKCQGGMPRNTKNKNIYVLINHPMMQKRDQKTWEPTTHE